MSNTLFLGSSGSESHCISSSACSGRTSLGMSSKVFNGPVVLSVTQPAVSDH